MNLIQALKQKKHVIWDFNGTIIDDLDLCVDIINKFLQKNSVDIISKQKYLETFEFPVINFYRKLGLDFTPEDFAQTGHHFYHHFREGLSTVSIHLQIKDVLTAVKEAKITQSLLSATHHDHLEDYLKHFDIHHLFDHVYGIQSKIADSKVKQGHQLFAKVNVDPQDTILIGDTLHDLEVGESLGVEVILLAHGHQCAKKLRANHHTVIDLNS